MELFNSLTDEDKLHASIKEMYEIDIEAGWKRLQSRFPSTLGNAPFTGCSPETQNRELVSDPASINWGMYPVNTDREQPTLQFRMTIKFGHADEHVNEEMMPCEDCYEIDDLMPCDKVSSEQ